MNRVAPQNKQDLTRFIASELQNKTWKEAEGWKIGSDGSQRLKQQQEQERYLKS